MIIRCTKCGTEFDLDPGQVGPEGVTLRCSVCAHMFHAEPEPEVDTAPGPWRLATVEKHLFERPRLRDIAEDIEDGRLRPEDQISHTGQHWLKLGEIPEMSSLFVGLPGQDELPRVFRPIDDASGVHGLGPPPSFGTGVDEPAPVRRDRFDLGGPNDPLPEPALPTIDDDGPLPAPPQFDTPAPRPGRAQRKTGGVAVASMLDAVTKAVAAPSDEPEEGRPSGSVRSRSQPILVSDLARAAAQSVAAAVQRVDDQRAAERSLRESRDKFEPSSERRATGSSGSIAAAAAAAAATAASRTEPSTGRIDIPKSATAAAVAAAVSAAPAPTSIPPASPPAAPTPAPPPPAPIAEPSAAVVESAITEPPKPPVVIVKVAEPAPRSGSGGVFALAGVLVAVGVVFGVPSIREKVFNLGGGPPVVAKGDTKTAAAKEQPAEFAAARNAMRNLGIRETTRTLSGLERIIDAADSDPADVAAAKLIQAELMLMRVLSSQIAVMLDPASSQAQMIIDSDVPDAAALVEGIGGAADKAALARVRVLLALAQGKPEADALAAVPADAPGSRELRALALGAPLWKSRDAAVPSGLITSLQGVPNPTALHQSLLALALWRSGDDEGARKVLDGVLGRVGDMSAARSLRAALDQSAAEKGEVLPPPPEPPVEPPSEPVPTDTPPSEPPTKADTPRTPRPTPPTPTPTPGLELDSIDALIQTGCQKVRNGDATGGVKLLHQAVDKRGNFQHFELCMCLANGFLAQNNHDTALAWFKRAVTQSPASRDAIAGAARAAELAGPQKETVAIEYYKKLLDIEPGNQAARNYLAKHGGVGGDGKATPPVDDVPELIPVGKNK